MENNHIEQQKPERKKPKKRVIVCAVIMTIMVVIYCIALVRCPQMYTTQRNMENIKRLADKRYVESGDYDSLSVYPLYDETDKVKYFLVEMSPSAYVFVKPRTPQIGNLGQYSRSADTVERPWRRYRICEDGSAPLSYEGEEWKADSKYTSGKEKNYRYETDDKGDFIEYAASPYAVAGVLGQKLYMLYVGNYQYVPAIRQGSAFFNLISMETFDYSTATDLNTPSLFMSFFIKHSANL